MNLTRRSLFASAVALLALPRRVADERLLGPAQTTWTTGWIPMPDRQVTTIWYCDRDGVVRMVPTPTAERARFLSGTWRCG